MLEIIDPANGEADKERRDRWAEIECQIIASILYAPDEARHLPSPPGSDHN